MSTGSGTIISCGGNGDPVGPLTITFTHHKRADILLWLDTQGLGPVKAAAVEHLLEIGRKFIGEGIAKITGDEYYVHTGDPPPTP